MAGTGGSFSRSVFEGGVKRGSSVIADTLVGRRGPLRGGSVVGYVNRSQAPVGGAPMGAHRCCGRRTGKKMVGMGRRPGSPKGVW